MPAEGRTLLIIDQSNPESLAALRKFARSIARGVCRDYRFAKRCDEERELEGSAYLLLVEYAARYDESRMPKGADVVAHFKNTFSRSIRHALRREALKLRNGGLYRTTSLEAGKWLRCVPLPVGRDGSDLLVDPRSVG